VDENNTQRFDHYREFMPASMIPHHFERLTPDEQRLRADLFYEEMDRRRSVRFFSKEPVQRHLVEQAIRAASTAPSGAHRQPWTFVLTGDPDVKRRIRVAAEEEERVNYEGGRLPQHWREALEPLGTDWHKEFLETVPWIVVLFEQRYGLDATGARMHNFYVKESCGIAAGVFITALHHMGLATLTHTPSPMAFLTKLLGRPENERPFCMFPIGYPADDCVVPDLRRKTLDQVMVEV
jgi:nitroreductase